MIGYKHLNARSYSNYSLLFGQKYENTYGVDTIITENY